MPPRTPKAAQPPRDDPRFIKGSNVFIKPNAVFPDDFIAQRVLGGANKSRLPPGRVLQALQVTSRGRRVWNIEVSVNVGDTVKVIRTAPRNILPTNPLPGMENDRMDTTEDIVGAMPPLEDPEPGSPTPLANPPPVVLPDDALATAALQEQPLASTDAPTIPREVPLPTRSHGVAWRPDDLDFQPNGPVPRR